jgi:hypothetical protein
MLKLDDEENNSEIVLVSWGLAVSLQAQSYSTTHFGS